MFLLATINYVDRIVLSVSSAPIAEEFGISKVELGYLFSSFLWLYVVCLVPIVLIGVFLTQTLKSNVEGRALSNAREQARLVADVGLSTPLASIDDLSSTCYNGDTGREHPN